MANLDLRPATGTIPYELLRLGMVFDHSEGDTAQVWMNYKAGLRVDIASLDATSLVFTDQTTRLPTVVKVSDLPGYASVLTWQSDNPLTTPASLPAAQTTAPTTD
mgnify:CR=1 FL=1